MEVAHRFEAMDFIVVEATVRSLHNGSPLFISPPPADDIIVLATLGGKVRAAAVGRPKMGFAFVVDSCSER